MNIKKTLVIGYRVLCVAVTLIEAADLGKTIYGKYKNKKVGKACNDNRHNKQS